MRHELLCATALLAAACSRMAVIAMQMHACLTMTRDLLSQLDRPLGSLQGVRASRIVHSCAGCDSSKRPQFRLAILQCTSSASSLFRGRIGSPSPLKRCALARAAHWYHLENPFKYIYICNLIFKAESGKLRPSKLCDEIAVCLENWQSVVLRV